jgi:DNA modification methylase
VSFTIHHGDALAVLRTMPDASVHCCVTSPPYYGLRNYGVAGQIGLEPTPEAFVQKLVEVFREVRRVLRDDGTLWLNLGDSYAGGKTGRADHGSGDASCKLGPKRDGIPGGTVMGPIAQRLVPAGYKPKDLIGIPWRVAFALQADGWYLRSEIIWAKRNCMPESVTDRPTKAHEQVFLLAKRERYFYDAEAIKEPVTGGAHARGDGVNPKCAEPGSGVKQNSSFSAAVNGLVSNRNCRSVWTLGHEATPEAHFATFPIRLAERCILAGCPAGGTVLDPFAGAGTTGLAALKHGRQFVGSELNAEYITLAYGRARKYYPLLMEATA